jgi:hypothetical protein
MCGTRPPEEIFENVTFHFAPCCAAVLQDMASGQWHLHHGVIDKVPGAAPNDPASFQLKDHFSVPVALGQQ